jgi:hypothetical protein
MRLGVGLVAGAAFLAMLLLDTQAVLQMAWMAALGRLGVWPQRLLVGVAALAACGLAMARVRRPRKAGRAAVRRRAAQAAAPGKVARKGSPGPKGRRSAAPGLAGGPAGRAPAKPSRA